MSLLPTLKNWIPGLASKGSGASGSSQPLGETLSLFRAQAIGRSKDIADWKHSEEARLQRAITAQANGLDASQFALPMPGNTTNITQSGQSGSGPAGLLPYLTGAALLAAGGWAVSALTGPRAPTTAPANPPAVAQPTTSEQVGVTADLIVEPPNQ